MWILLGVIVVIVLIIIMASLQGNKKANPVAPTGEGTPTGTEEPTTTEPETQVIPANTVLKDSRVEVPGANPITKDNKVVTLEGKVTKNDVAPSSPLAPQETGALTKEQVPPTAVTLELSAAGFNPKEFTVKAGAPVTVAVTATDGVHTFAFEDASLSAVGMGLYAGQTRAVTFNAPEKAGEYVFYCNVGGTIHKNRGEVGKMIVK